MLSEIIERVAAGLSLPRERVADLLETPPDETLGDYALPCFSFAKELQKPPAAIAAAFATKIKSDDLIERAEAKGPYLNLFLRKASLTNTILQNILAAGERYGDGEQKEEKVMIEYSQPNTHKAFHVGHLRGTSIGEALARILKKYGYRVIQANYSGDTGMHVAKWLWCYINFHKGEKPPQEGRGRWLANIYVEAVKRLAEHPEGEAAVRELNRKLDEGNEKELVQLWQETREWSVAEFRQIYQELDAHFDVWWFEREFEARAKSISSELVKRGIAEESEGAIIVNLEKYGLGVWVLLRDDGTPLYSAKDLALAEKKFNEYDITRNIYVVGKAQALHLQQLFKTLELMEFPHAEKCFHLSFEEVRLPDGKMSSRTGRNILYQDLREEVYARAQSEIEERHEEWSDKEVAKVAEQVTVCALKFEMIARDHNKPIIFDAARVCDFEGDTGPYIQYTHARCNSILKKWGEQEGKKQEKQKGSGLQPKYTSVTLPEYRLAKKLHDFPNILATVAETFYPEHLAKYVLELAKLFNKFYHECPVLGSQEESSRLALVEATRNVLEQSLILLGIPAPKQM